MKKRVLALNCGSSSLKYAVFDVVEATEEVVLRGEVEDVNDHAKAVNELLGELAGKKLRPDVVGHRVAHGGTALAVPTRVDAPTLKKLDALVALAPLHLPSELAAIRAVLDRWPDTPQVASFDTAFHRTMHAVAQRYALPSSLLDFGVRRYGFHGLSCEYVVSKLGSALRPRTIVAHLGSGVSLTAIRDGESIDTTMGFSPTSGVPMATRSGDLDPGLVVHLLKLGISLESLDRMLQRESGLLALSERTGDMKELVASRDSDPYAAFAIEFFCTSIRKAIGSLASVLGGLDGLVFTGGIGERAPFVRAEIARGLVFLGVEIDANQNQRNLEGCIHTGPCEIRIVHTDEERMVARHAFEVL